MCFGNFHSAGEMCSSCKVARSCKHESLHRIKCKRDRGVLQCLKFNSLEKFSDNDSKLFLYNFLLQYPRGASTYRLTKDFKRQYNINVSDAKILSLCSAMEFEKTIFHTGANVNGAPRIWHVVLKR